MVVSRAIIRDLYSRDRVGSMISLVIAVMMIGADAERARPAACWRPRSAGAPSSISSPPPRSSSRSLIAMALPETRRDRGDERRLPRRRRQADPRPRLHRLCAVPGAGLADHLHLRRRRTLHRGDADGPHQRRIRRVVRDAPALPICVGNLFCVALRAAPFAGEADLVRAGAAIRRRPAEPDLRHHRARTRRRHGCSAPR